MAVTMKVDDLKPILAMKLDVIPIRKWDARGKNNKIAGKIPRDSEWQIKTYRAAMIKEWIKAGGNIGVRLRAGELVIDVDPKHDDAKGRTAEELVDELELELGISFEGAPVVKTGSGGWHIYLKKDSEYRIRNNIKLFGGAIEFKSFGRQVLAPGCRHPNGDYYSWVRNAGAELPNCPRELWALIRRAKPEERKNVKGAALKPKQILSCLKQLDPGEFRDYELWRNIMFSVHYSSGGDHDSRDVFINWSTADPEYSDAGDTIEAMWDSADEFRSDARTERTLYHYVLAAGGNIPIDLDVLGEVEDPQGEEGEKRPLPVFERDSKGRIKHTSAENVLLAMAHFGMGQMEDVFSGKRYTIDLRGVLEKHFEKCHGEDYGDRTRELIAMALAREVEPWTGDPSKATMNRAVQGIRQNVHPLKNYLDGLKWDGKHRTETWLIEASDLEDTPYNRAVSRLLLYAAVGRVMSPGIKFDTMFILEGPQGGGKSTLIRFLADTWAAEGLPPITGQNHKDVISAMRGKWLIEIEELSAMKKSDVDELKSFLSRTEDRARLPYEEETRTFPRCCIFIGTTNTKEYLTDLTGNRRHLPLDVGVITGLEFIHRDQLWAEAMAEWREKPAKKEIHLPESLWETAACIQESRRIIDPWEEKIRTMLFDKWKTEDYISSESILWDGFQLQLQNAGPHHARRISNIMNSLGWERCVFRDNSGRQVRGYKRKD